MNKKCDIYCSRERDSEALLINAMTLDWSPYYWYAFPPFSLIPRILKKIIEEGSRGIIVVPYWCSQPWYTIFIKLLASEMLFFNPSDSLLLSPCRKLIHPLAQCTKPYPGISSASRQTYEKQNLRADTIEILTKSVRVSTSKHDSHLKFWWNFCAKNNINPHKADEKAVLTCLTDK